MVIFCQVQVYYLLTWAVSPDHRCSQRRAPRGPPTSRPGPCWSGLRQPRTWFLFSFHWFFDFTGICSNVCFSGTCQNLTSARWQNHQTHGESANTKLPDRTLSMLIQDLLLIECKTNFVSWQIKLKQDSSVARVQIVRFSLLRDLTLVNGLVRDSTCNKC